MNIKEIVLIYYKQMLYLTVFKNINIYFTYIKNIFNDYFGDCVCYVNYLHNEYKKKDWGDFT